MASGNRLKRRFTGFIAQHLRALVASLGHLVRVPVASLMTAGVIGIALALPAGFLLFLQNVEAATGDWQGGVQISLFIKAGVSEDAYRQLAATLRSDPEVSNVRVVTPAQGLAEFRAKSGFKNALDLLGENPLPPVLVIRPIHGLAPARIETMAANLKDRPEVDRLRMDRQWLQRLHAIMRLVRRGIWVVAGLLAVAVMLVVGNTIRLDIENRRDEIVITKLIGATDRFVRRPFLYEGIWYGVAGALLACVLIEIGYYALSGPAGDLSVLYDSNYLLRGLGFSGTGWLLLAGVALGLLGSWLAVGRHLAAIEPR